jgi:hypothetical protein
MNKPTAPTYRTTNWRAYNAALKQRGSLQIWFDPETVWLAEPSGKRGRSATFTDASSQACLTLKALFGLPLRQTTWLVASLLKLAGLDWAVQDFSTAMERLSPTKPGRNKDAMLQAARGTRHGTRLRQAGGRATDPSGNPEPLHGPRDAANSTRGMSLSKGRGNSTSG